MVVRDCNLLRAALLRGNFYDIPEKSDAYPSAYAHSQRSRCRRLPAWACYLRDVEDVSFRHNRFRLRHEDARQGGERSSAVKVES